MKDTSMKHIILSCSIASSLMTLALTEDALANTRFYNGHIGEPQFEINLDAIDQPYANDIQTAPIKPPQAYQNPNDPVALTPLPQDVMGHSITMEAPTPSVQAPIKLKPPQKKLPPITLRRPEPKPAPQPEPIQLKPPSQETVAPKPTPVTAAQDLNLDRYVPDAPTTRTVDKTPIKRVISTPEPIAVKPVVEAHKAPSKPMTPPATKAPAISDIPDPILETAAQPVPRKAQPSIFNIIDKSVNKLAGPEKRKTAVKAPMVPQAPIVNKVPAPSAATPKAAETPEPKPIFQKMEFVEKKTTVTKLSSKKEIESTPVIESTKQDTSPASETPKNPLDDEITIEKVSVDEDRATTPIIWEKAVKPAPVEHVKAENINTPMTAQQDLSVPPELMQYKPDAVTEPKVTAEPEVADVAMAKPVPSAPAEPKEDFDPASLIPETAPVIPSETPSQDRIEVAALPSLSDLSLAFDGSSKDLDTNTRIKLDELAQQMSANENLRIQLRSYAASTDGSKSSSRRIALSRALEVRRYLTDTKDIRPTRIDVRALGDETDRTPLNRVDMVFVN